MIATISLLRCDRFVAGDTTINSDCLDDGSTMAQMSDMPSRADAEPWLAFELLLAWAEAIVRQRTRLEIALSRLTRPSRATSTEERHVEVHERRFADHTFNTERHLFIEAAWQLIEHRKRVGKLGILGDDAFRELDGFEKDVKALRDHAIEYLKGGRDHPGRWIYQAETSDLTAVSGLGEHLDYVAFSDMVERLRRTLYKIDPNNPDRAQALGSSPSSPPKNAERADHG